jgi:hypothetical protein
MSVSFLKYRASGLRRPDVMENELPEVEPP